MVYISCLKRDITVRRWEWGGGGGVRTSDSTTSMRGYNLTYSRLKTEETDRQTDRDRETQREKLTSDASGL